MADGLLTGGAYFGNPNIQRQGARARALAQQRDVNTLPDPRTYAAASGLFGTAPDQMGFSVLNPRYESIMQTARPAFAVGTALGVAPFTKGLPVGASIRDIGKKNINVQLNEASNFLSAKSPFGEVGGTIRPPDRLSDTPYLQINYAEVEQASRGTGKGKELYQSLIDDAQARGLRVFSDSTVEKQAVNVYKSLGKKDYELRDMTKGSLEGGAVYGAGAKNPAFEILPKQSFQYPQEEAMRLAQQRAALPVEQGGLGLPVGNTAEQRAKAMGFDYNTTRFHGSDQDIYAFDPAKFGKNDQGWYGRGVTTDTDPEIASGYANYNEAESGQMVYPLLTRGKYMDWPEGQPPFSTARDSTQGTKDIQVLGYQGTRMTNDRDLYGGTPQIGTEQVTFNPDDVRSRFAAFDPFRRNAAIAATMGVAAPNLLANEVNSRPVNPMYTDPFGYSIR